MISDVMILVRLILSFLPFVLFVIANFGANVKKGIRNRQYIMPIVGFVYGVVFLALISRITPEQTYEIDFHLYLVQFNTQVLTLYIVVKRIITAIFGRFEIRKDSFIGSAVDIFYTYDDEDKQWYIKEHFGQARTYIKAAYYCVCIAASVAFLGTCVLYLYGKIATPFSAAPMIIIFGEFAFFLCGKEKCEAASAVSVQADKSRRVAMYPLLRKPLKALFGDKLSADGTTVNNSAISGGAVEDVLFDLEHNGGHIGENYAAFIRKKMENGQKASVDYVRSGYDLATGKSLLFNTPFYDKLNPYVFYAMNRTLLTGGKVLVVLGRHGTEDDLYQWCDKGMQGMSNVQNMWRIGILSGKKCHPDDLPDIGIISRSGVHDLDIHKNNLPFLKEVAFVMIVEPSRLVTTAQIGLNLLIKCCGMNDKITFCSVDRNCDGLVDALSHILMTNITEVSATEYPQGMSSYMYWTADDEHLQHRILPGVSRYLGMGTELSMVALKNQIKKTVWYGGDAFPVLDARWIAKQYYYDLLNYAKLPANQETFDKCFQTSFNMCNERVCDYSFITVEDDRNNLFEMRRNFATIAQQQGFVNVISSDYMLRSYMAENPDLFTADAKAIPYITADYARTKRNSILSLCLLLCIDSVQEDMLNRQMMMLNIDTKEPVAEIWKEVCVIFGNKDDQTFDKHGNPTLIVKSANGKLICFERDTTILFKRAYSVESGRFESVYTIENADFARIILDDLQNAIYIAEQESKDEYIGTELKGHVYQKYLPGQFFTLNGKYYEMVSTTTDNRILVRRASEHIDGRNIYRQVRNYTIHAIEDSAAMGAQKTVNNIDIHYQFADFSVETPGYWKLGAYNDYEHGDLVNVNGVPNREYHHKQILKFDFSKLGDAFTDSVRMTLTNLLNETFVTLFAENQPFISAITPGVFETPITYNLSVEDGIISSDKCIYIIEDSQLDIGLLVAVERNVNRIFQIISDYLAWNEKKNAPAEEQSETQELDKSPLENLYDASETKTEKKKGFFGKIGEKIKNRFKKKEKADVVAETEEPIVEETVAETEEPTAEETAVEDEKAVDEDTTEESTENKEEVSENE